MTAMLLLSFSNFGCNTRKAAETIAQKKQEAELKKNRFESLQADLASGVLRQGADPKGIREYYGEPDNIFRSGSQASSMEIWTYEKLLDKEDEEWEPIRLYFNNHKLVTWVF